jgi:hypothetical protein
MKKLVVVALAALALMGARSRAKEPSVLSVVPLTPDASQVTRLGSNIITSKEDLGVGLFYWYISWPDMKGDGMATALNLMSATAPLALNLSVVRTSTLDKYPAPWTHFNQPGFAEAYAADVVTFVRKYKPKYVFIGNEPNIYLDKYPQDKEAYLNVVRQVTTALILGAPYEGIPNGRPRVGLSISFDTAVAKNQRDLLLELSKTADLIGYTIYPDDGNFHFTDPSDSLEELQQLGKLVPERPFAIVETSWNTSALLSSSDEKQVVYVEKLFQFRKTGEAEFINWFTYSDGADCRKIAGAFIPGIEPPLTFQHFLCYDGLYKNDGTPKPAVARWKALLKE